MATADTVKLGDAHKPKSESILVFEHIQDDLKRQLIHMRREQNKHEPEFFAAASELSDAQLTSFSADNFELVRVAASAYGIHLFSKLRIPALDESGPAYILFRAFDASPAEKGSTAKLHCIHTEDKELSDGKRAYRAIFTKDDQLEWFDT